MATIESIIWVIVSWWITVWDMSTGDVVLTVVMALMIVGGGWWIIKRIG